MKIKNIGILAHVDAGKTTLTEQLLYQTGAIRQLGRVDHGNTRTDSLELERERGISIKSMPTSYWHNGYKINIIDTPGHVDFVAEVERSLLLLDGAVLVISAREGVQTHTRLLFNALRRMQIPTLLFINKIDRMGADLDAVLSDIRAYLTPNILALQTVHNLGQREVTVESLELQADDALIDMLSDVDDMLFMDYLDEQPITSERLQTTLQAAIATCAVYPVLFGSALQSIGLPEILEGINQLLPDFIAQQTTPNEPCGVVASIQRLPSIAGRSSVIKVMGGIVELRAVIGEDRITNLYQFNKGELIPVERLTAGDIGVATGLHNLSVGETFGTVTHKGFALGEPTLKVKLTATSTIQRKALLQALTFMSESDPYLSYELNHFNDDIYITLFGYVQLEIIEETLKRDYGLNIDIDEPMIILTETPLDVAERIIFIDDDTYPFCAGLGLRIAPLPRGSGIVYRTDAINMGGLISRFRNGIREGIMDSLAQGLYGWELTDMEITVIDYKVQPCTTPVEFRDLAPLVLFEALASVGTQRLWPIYAYELTIPATLMGRAMRDLQQMRASFDTPTIVDDVCTIIGQVPVANTKNYGFEVQNYSGGMGHFETHVIGYEVAPDDITAERPRFKIDPANLQLYLREKRR